MYFNNYNINDMKYFVQESIGGWRQSPIYSGSKSACRYYCRQNNMHFGHIVSEEELVIDYL